MHEELTSAYVNGKSMLSTVQALAKCFKLFSTFQIWFLSALEVVEIQAGGRCLHSSTESRRKLKSATSRMLRVISVQKLSQYHKWCVGEWRYFSRFSCISTLVVDDCVLIAENLGKDRPVAVEEDTDAKSKPGTLILEPAPQWISPNGHIFYSLVTFYTLTLLKRGLPEKLTGPQLVRKFPAFYKTRSFITAFATARSIQSMSSIPLLARSILIVSSHLHVGRPSSFLPSGFPTKTLYARLLSPMHATWSSHLSFLIWSPEWY